MRLFASALLVCLTAGPVDAACLNAGMQLQVLGSGGPANSGGRASSGYLLWIDGVARVMVDAGSGTKDQFHASGATLADLQLIAIKRFSGALGPSADAPELSLRATDPTWPGMSARSERPIASAPRTRERYRR